MKNYTNTSRPNIITSTDAYKQTHWMQYPVGLTNIYSYLESRGGDFPGTLFYGLQMLLKKHFLGPVVEGWMLDEAEEFCRGVFAKEYFNRKGWERILTVHEGRLPIRIKAVPEGTLVPFHNVLMTVENTDPEVPFITNFVETLLMQIWYPITVATKSFYIKKLIEQYAQKAGEHVGPFHLNDFGYRGVSSKESAGIGGSAHLVNFLGTDTLAGIEAAMKYYQAPAVNGYSVMAAEHSTVTTYGPEGEAAAYARFLDICPDDGILSVVCDSYDTIEAVSNIFGKQLRDRILARKGKLVVRPDSGDPAVVSVEVLQSLWKSFGGTTNAEGYKVLPPQVGVIYGDGIDYKSIDRILFNVVDLAGFAPSNIIFGMGGALLQQVNRDTMQFAFKCSAAKINDAWVDIYKQPKTDSGKNSKRGRLVLVRDEASNFTTVNNMWASPEDVMTPVFEDGELLREHTFEEIRARANQEFARYSAVVE